MHREYIILIDDREKRPLPFPSHLPIYNPITNQRHTVRLITRTRQLLTADYMLEGETRPSCLIERKASIDELHKNLCTERGRRNFLAECDRLKRDCDYPILLVEGSPSSMAYPRLSGSDVEPVTVQCHLLMVLHAYRISLIMLPGATSQQRTLLGEWVARTLILASECKATVGQPPVEPVNGHSTADHTVPDGLTGIR